MPRKRPERAEVERMLKEDQKQKAHEIAKATGLTDTMGYDKAVEYVNQVRKSMRKKGELEDNRYAPDMDRLEDITKLFELRKGKMRKRVAYTMLLLNCYLRLRAADDSVHAGAIDDTYRKNEELQEPFTIHEAIKICDLALKKYIDSQDEEKNKAAQAKSQPNAGINYTTENLIIKLEVMEEEERHLRTIKRT